MTFRHEVDSENTLRIWREGIEAPVLLQPHYPNGDAWTSEQAEEWAAIYITSIEDPTAPLPGPSAEHPSVPRPEVPSAE